MTGVSVHVTGVVQGVGFRPYVYALAKRHGLMGYCFNDSSGVTIHLQGEGTDVFIDELKKSPPPLARIDEINVSVVTGGRAYEDFTIVTSVDEAGSFALVSPDIATCDECAQELFDPENRRYLYPFINCTNCGPRYSIIKKVPYDRPNTTMSSFILCAECEGEYHDPSNRRFHAQPNACAKCGPRIWVEGRDKAREEGYVNAAGITRAQKLLKDGAILAIKGLGGFHLACDATNDRAVARLRSLKRRSRGTGAESMKPFAIMASDISAIRGFCSFDEVEAKALAQRSRPIVLLEKKGPCRLSASIAPGNSHIGVMLPYTPLHLMLFHEAPYNALVMTSGNMADEPIVISNDEATGKLSTIADAFIMHDRNIHMRVDDSVAFAQGGKARLVRRSRGYAPEPIELGEKTVDILACGAGLKNTFCLTRGSKAIVSQHIGDLENAEALAFFEETLLNLQSTYRANPRVIAHDLHPDYLSTTFALKYAKDKRIPKRDVIAVQHHHAHIASVMAEAGLKGEVIGVAFDGTGLGTDGAIWGGEFLVASRTSFRRKAHLSYIGLPGGDRAVEEPWRMGLAYLWEAFGDSIEIGKYLHRLERSESGIVMDMIKKQINTPLTSSAGRLFDAVSSILGICDEATFEGEAAIALEAFADPDETRGYGFDIVQDGSMTLDMRPTIAGLTSDIVHGVPHDAIAGRFHNTVAEAIVEVCKRIRAKTKLTNAILSGGVFQNRLLINKASALLTSSGFDVWTNETVPTNDGGVSLGQAIVAWERVKGHVSGHTGKD